MRNYFGPLRMGGKRIRAVVYVGQDFRPGGRLLRDQAREGGEEAGAKIERSSVDG